MRTKILATVGTLAVAGAVLAGVATAGSAGSTAGSTAKKQRVAIVLNDESSTFVLTPLKSGPIGQDSGTFSSCCWTRRLLTRDGQSIEIDNPKLTFTGKRGKFSWRARITFVDLNNDYTVVTGVWKIVSGTGEYAHLEGHGRQAFVEKTDGSSSLANKAEGLMGLRP